MITARILTPAQAGDINGDYYYELDGERSSNSYATKSGAKKALYRAIDKKYGTE